MKDNISYKQQYSGSRTSADHADPWWLSPAPVIAPQPLEKQDESGDVEPDHNRDDTFGYPDAFFSDGDEFDAINEFHWSNLPDRDRNYLSGPRNHYPAPCPWCGGRYRHNRLCDELRASWEPTLPFGKYKGKPLAVVPCDYLEWLVNCGDGISTDIRDAIQNHLRSQGTHDHE